MTANRPTDPRPRLLIVGAGVAGLTAAQELCADFEITVIERNAQPGGKCRSWIDPVGNVPAEHGWRFFNKTYHNMFDTMRRIPAAHGGTVFENLRRKRQRPLTYLPTILRQHGPYTARDLWEAMGDALRLLRIVSLSDERIRRYFAADSFESHLTRDGRKNLVHALITDFIGVIWSAEKAGFDLKVTLNMLDNFVVNRLALFNLDGPTQQTLIEPWREHLTRRGVSIRTNAQLVSFRKSSSAPRVAAASWLEGESGRERSDEFDFYLSAIPNDELLRRLDPALLDAAPALRAIERIERIWQNGVMIYTRIPQRLRLNVFSRHPWKITVVSHAEHWQGAHDLSQYGIGKERGQIGDVLSFVISDWHTPGVRRERPARACSPNEIYEELCFACESEPGVIENFERRDHVVFERPGGALQRCVVDASLVYDAEEREIVANTDPVVSYPPGSYFSLPGAVTPIENLFLASTYCYNAFGCCATMEGANETGRRAANAILAASGREPRVPIFEGKRAGLAMKAIGLLRRFDAWRLPDDAGRLPLR